MDYEKLYKDALSRAKKLKETCDSKAVVGWCEYIFPELRESEDEKIRKELIDFVKSRLAGFPDCKRFTDWLEKQGASSDKIHYWTEEEIEPIISDYLRGAEHYGGMICRLRCLKPKSIEKQDEQKPFDYENANIQQKDFATKVEPNPAWSEYDEEYLRRAIKATKDVYPITVDWLKSLKGRLHPQWKPSEEQIQALEYQVNSTYKGSWQYKASKELLEQLKKL